MLQFQTLQYQQNQVNRKQMNFGQYCHQIKESINKLELAVESASPIQHPPCLAFKPPTHERHNSSAMSIQDDINAFEAHSNQYKCFKCYGMHNIHMTYSAPICQECDGTQTIADTHPIVSLFEKVLRAKCPFLRPKLQQDANSYTCFDSITSCRSCNAELQTEQGLTCESCPEYHVCQKCFDEVPKLHISTHRFIKKADNRELFRLKQNIPAMKKISEEYESQEMQEIHCSNCGEQVEECYETCLDCGLQGKNYLLCGSCSELQLQHEPTHKMMMKTVNKNSKLENMFHSEIEEKAIILADSIEYEDSNSSPRKMQPEGSCDTMEQSIVNIPEISMEVSDEMLCSNPEYSMIVEHKECHHIHSTQSIEVQSQSYNPETPESPPKSQTERKKGFCRRESSIIQINMDDSMDRSITPKIAIKGVNFAQEQVYHYVDQPRSHRMLVQEDQQEEYVFNNYQCDLCECYPIKNKRYHCRECEDFDICNDCFQNQSSRHEHQDYELIDGQSIMRERKNRFNKVVDGIQRFSMGLPIRKSFQSNVQ